MNTTINRLMAIGYTREKAAVLYCLYNRQDRAAELEEYIALKESLANNERARDKNYLSY